jgi:hypothetical protein
MKIAMISHHRIATQHRRCKLYDEWLAHKTLEVSPNNRAGCKDTECKKNAEKITKGTLRFGSWVTIQEHGSWSWKHW